MERERYQPTIPTAKTVESALEQITDGTFEEIQPPEKFLSQEIADKLKRDIYGQDEACLKAGQEIVRIRDGTRDPKQPLGAMIFFGLTGTGKSLLGEKMAEQLFPRNTEDHIVRLSGEEFQKGSSIGNLAGGEVGFVGFGTDPKIMPHQIVDGAVVLFDEIEKAHPDIWRWFLGPLQKGYATVYLPTNEPDPNGSRGKKIVPKKLDFTNTYFIFTSNEGAREMVSAKLAHQQPKNLGFVRGDSASTPVDYHRIVMDKLKTGKFGDVPEFLGRIGQPNLLVFNELKPEHYPLIFNKFFDEKLENQRHNNPRKAVNLSVMSDVKEWIIEQANVELFGARDIKATMDATLFQLVADYNQSNLFLPGAFVQAYMKNGEIRFRQSSSVFLGSNVPETQNVRENTANGDMNMDSKGRELVKIEPEDESYPAIL